MFRCMGKDKSILTFAVETELLERISDFRFTRRIESKSEAIRLLIKMGLESLEKKRRMLWVIFLEIK